MKIGLLGGAFNPPHLGHLFVAQQVLDFTDCEEVWFLPNYRQIPPKPVAPVAHRLAMVRLLELPKTRVSTIEIDHELDGDTVHILPHLPKDHDYSFIIGSDQLSSIHLWGQWETLVSSLPFFVFPRYGFPNEPLYPNMSLVHSDMVISSNLSSTKIRERISRGLSVDQFVPPAICWYIQRHGLYR